VGEDGGGGGSCGIINPWHWLLFGGSRPAAVLKLNHLLLQLKLNPNLVNLHSALVYIGVKLTN
jgi:hypothetical protein